MEIMKSYVPKSKGDDEAVENLWTCTFESVRADVPELLTWLQDMNWPVAYGVAKYLRPHVNEIEDELLNVLNGNDEQWKSCIMGGLIARSSQPTSEKLIAVVKRIAEQPTKLEQYNQTDEAAKEALEVLGV